MVAAVKVAKVAKTSLKTNLNRLKFSRQMKGRKNKNNQLQLLLKLCQRHQNLKMSLLLKYRLQ